MGKLGKTYTSSLDYQKMNSAEYYYGKNESRARKGFVPMLVGREDDVMERLDVPTKLIEHPYIAALLDLSADEFGYEQEGLIRIQFDANSFKHMVKKISKEKRLPYTCMVLND